MKPRPEPAVLPEPEPQLEPPQSMMLDDVLEVLRLLASVAPHVPAEKAEEFWHLFLTLSKIISVIPTLAHEQTP